MLCLQGQRKFQGDHNTVTKRQQDKPFRKGKRKTWVEDPTAYVTGDDRVVKIRNRSRDVWEGISWPVTPQRFVGFFFLKFSSVDI